jgi:hypothetical protein
MESYSMFCIFGSLSILVFSTVGNNARAKTLKLTLTTGFPAGESFNKEYF